MGGPFASFAASRVWPGRQDRPVPVGAGEAGPGLLPESRKDRGREPAFGAGAPAGRFGGSLIESALVGALIGTAVVLGMNLRELADRNGGYRIEIEAPQPTRDAPPAAARPEILPAPAGGVRFAFPGDGSIAVTGLIEQGAAARFEAALEAHPGPVVAVTLDSPGGALGDAMAMARLIRARRMATLVPAGAVCASSCPLVLAGGVRRRAADGARVGVHQFYAGAAMRNPAQAMVDTQLVTARITRHLRDMGVDPQLWLHALETPPHSLYRLTAPEMLRYGLITAMPPPAAG